MSATVCEECCTRDGVIIVCWEDEKCRRCGHQPVRGALTPREIRACIRARAEKDRE